MTHSEVQIRQANDTDLTAIVELNYGLFQEDAGQRDPSMNLEWPRQHGMEYFRDMLTGTKSVCFVAVTDAETVGYLVGYVREPNDLCLIKSAELESMFVLPAWRSRQVGSQLFQTFLIWARERGAQSISVSAYAANERAIAFYQSHGFKPKNLILEIDCEMPQS
ncbi:MAG: GNAT family N-acetyltransferase [Chloroflexota bacterium]